MPVRLESRFGALNDTNDLNNRDIPTDNGRIIPLSYIVSFSGQGAATELERHEQQRGIKIEANLVDGIALGQAVAKVAQLRDVLPEGLSLAFQGNAERTVFPGLGADTVVQPTCHFHLICCMSSHIDRHPDMRKRRGWSICKKICIKSGASLTNPKSPYTVIYIVDSKSRQ